MMTTRCDSNDDDGDDDVEVDPYDNLPETDEPTHCSICLTYRQGPCRPYWRKVEACTKDNELPDKDEQHDDGNDSKNDGDGDDDDTQQRPDPPCFKYMMPWIDCASGYRNLYALIELDTNYTEGIADLEQTASEHYCWVPGKEPFTIDWSPWKEYVEILNPHWKLPSIPVSGQRKQSFKKRKHTRKMDNTKHGHTAAEAGSASSTPSGRIALWKTLDQSSDPELVQVEAIVPTKLEGGVLECAYALDQDNHVIGFAYGTKPSEAATKAGTATVDDDNAGEEDDLTVTLTIRLLPERTRHVVIAAAYTQVSSTTTSDNNKKNDGGEDRSPSNFIDPSHVYKSKPYMLDLVVATEKERRGDDEAA